MGGVWNNIEKLKWAKQAWGFIIDGGLAAFSLPVGRSRVVIRFLALAGIFSDFYEIAFSDGFEPEYLYLATGMGLTPFRLGQLVGSDPEWDNCNDDDLYSLLKTLADNARNEVYPTLVLGFGHVPSLFISLWKTSQVLGDAEDRDEVDLDNYIVNRDLTPEKQQAYSWLTEGCYTW